jgi:hypothetical protein
VVVPAACGTTAAEWVGHFEGTRNSPYYSDPSIGVPRTRMGTFTLTCP